MIKVGMLVEIIDTRIMKGPGQGLNDTRFLGHIGKVLGRSKVYPGEGWYIEGAEIDSIGHRRSFRSECLRPILPPHKDIEETRQHGAPSWDEMMNSFRIKHYVCETNN